ncbi:MAG: DNA mismatch repair protein MutS, partial [Rubrivivax sp.]
GTLGVTECGERELVGWLARLAPAELLHDGGEMPQALQAWRGPKTARPGWQFETALGERKLCTQLQVASLAGFNAQDLPVAQAAAAALLSYAEHTQGQALRHVQSLTVERATDLIDLPPSTHRNLELTQTLRGEEAPTLLSLLDTCRTGMGSRLLRHWLTHPARSRGPANQRHEALTSLMAAGFEPVRDALRHVSDVERITSRTALRQVRPRELAGLRATLTQLPGLRDLVPAEEGAAVVVEPEAHTPLGEAGRPQQPHTLLQSLRQALTLDPAVAAPLAAIADEPAVLLRDGGVIAPGFDAELDELRGIATNCDAFLVDLEQRERARTGIANLRVQFNKVHGFYIEVTTSGLDRVPEDYRRRQTLKNAERFITPELKAFEDKALSAQERSLAREKWLYEQVLDALQPHLGTLAALGRALAALDA